jgi:predicted O-methyltransferase YrrM
MMHIGNEKGKVLEQFLSQCLEAKTCLDGSLQQPQQSHSSNFICVELGTYCGYSSIWLARSLLKQFVVKGWDTCQSSSSREEIQLQRRQPTFKIYTVEVVPEHAKIAQEMIRMAKLEDFIEIIIFDPSDDGSVSRVVKNKIIETTNISKDSTVLASSTNVAIDFLFIDHDKTRYLADLKQFESSGMIREGCFVAADNVVFAAIDDYRQYVQDLHAKNIVTTRLEESMIEYSEPEIVQSQDGADQQKKINQLKDGIEMSIYQRDPSSLSSLERTTIKTPIILTMFPSQIMSGSASKANRTTVRTSEISRKNKRKIQKGGVVSIVAPSPIHSSPSFNQPLWLALLIGILLILHTPAWLVLIHFTDNDTRDDTDGFPILKYLKPGVKMLSVLILDVTPKVASTFLNIYLGGLCLYIGWSKLTKNG